MPTARRGGGGLRETTPSPPSHFKPCFCRSCIQRFGLLETLIARRSRNTAKALAIKREASMRHMHKPMMARPYAAYVVASMVIPLVWVKANGEA